MGMVLVDKGALRMALNVLRRAGKNEVADELEQSAQDVQPLPTFSTIQDANEWMDEQVDDPYQDNYRFAFTDDEGEMANYEHKQSTGCCGSFDSEVIVDGRKAWIGCNYGH